MQSMRKLRKTKLITTNTEVTYAVKFTLTSACVCTRSPLLWRYSDLFLESIRHCLNHIPSTLPSITYDALYPCVQQYDLFHIHILRLLQ